MKVSEVSVVSFPAYEKTDIQAAVRSLEAFKQANPQRTKQYFDTALRLRR